MVVEAYCPIQRESTTTTATTIKSQHKPGQAGNQFFPFFHRIPRSLNPLNGDPPKPCWAVGKGTECQFCSIWVLTFFFGERIEVARIQIKDQDGSQENQWKTSGRQASLNWLVKNPQRIQQKKKIKATWIFPQIDFETIEKWPHKIDRKSVPFRQKEKGIQAKIFTFLGPMNVNIVLETTGFKMQSFSSKILFGFSIWKNGITYSVELPCAATLLDSIMDPRGSASIIDQSKAILKKGTVFSLYVFTLLARE